MTVCIGSAPLGDLDIAASRVARPSQYQLAATDSEHHDLDLHRPCTVKVPSCDCGVIVAQGAQTGWAMETVAAWLAERAGIRRAAGRKAG